ncbi:hypothetical protein B0A55_06857 [Friedmanniomyces simplex]|uniref:Chaperone/heat shock protein Hsp12 n=1 Tax=Friedmanniomyces simplex TaxID=329884 RepID=A0A4U0XBR4_9PEZI|nr:hypothetical protein B0A55_06857 [Friedmanniomyces simplex]
MSDLGRKDFSDKLSEKVTPQESKSTTTKLSEGVTNLGDSASRNAVPDSEKSTTQKLSDGMTNEKHAHESGHTGHTGHTSATEPSLLDKAKDAVGMGK